jgi:hypothetical protein
VSYRNVVRLVTVVSIAALAVGPAALGKPKSPKPGGKKPIGVVATFEAESRELAVLTKGDVEYQGVVAEEVQVKVEHRGNHDRSGNPSIGTLADIEEGAKVLRMKESKGTGEVEKIRLRPAPEEECEVDDPEGEVEDPEVDDPEGEDPEDEVGEPQDPQDCQDEEGVEEGEG